MQNAIVDQILEPGKRVTVAMGTNRNLDSGNTILASFLFTSALDV